MMVLMKVLHLSMTMAMVYNQRLEPERVTFALKNSETVLVSLLSAERMMAMAMAMV